MSKITGYNSNDEHSVGAELKKIVEAQGLPVGDRQLEEERDKFDHKTDWTKIEESLLREEASEYDGEKIGHNHYNTLLETVHKGESEWKDLPEKKFEERKALSVPHRNSSAWEGDMPKLRELTNQIEKDYQNEVEEFTEANTEVWQFKNVGDQKDLPKHKITQNTPQQEDYDPTRSPSTKYYDGDNATKSTDREYFKVDDVVSKGLSNALASFNNKIHKSAGQEDMLKSIDELDAEFIKIASSKDELNEDDKKRIGQIKLAKSRLLGLIK